MDIRPTDNKTVNGAGYSGTRLEAQPATPGRGVDAVAPKDAANATAAPAPEELEQALSSINDVLKDRAPGLEFSFDKDDARLVVKVVDKETNEVIRQMPSREALEIAKALDKLQGLMARQSA